MQRKLKEQGKLSDEQLGRDDVGAFLAALSKIQLVIDPKFDIKKKPYLDIAPSSGLYPGGISPSYVKDPNERADYIRKNQENAEYIKHYAVQSKLVEKLDGVSGFYAAYLKKSIIDKGILTKDQILDLLKNGGSGVYISEKLENKPTQ